MVSDNHGLGRAPGAQWGRATIRSTVKRSYLSPSVFTVRSGPVWRQDLAILSPEGPRDNTCQLRQSVPSRLHFNLGFPGEEGFSADASGSSLQLIGATLQVLAEKAVQPIHAREGSW